MSANISLWDRKVGFVILSETPGCILSDIQHIEEC
jgi:hypothetical protein